MDSNQTPYDRIVTHLRKGVVALGTHREHLQGLVGQHLEHHDETSVAPTTSEEE